MNESSCWIELADLYCENCDYEEALYCMEECVLIDPYNCHVHNRVADLYYTLGIIQCLNCSHVVCFVNGSC